MAMSWPDEFVTLREELSLAWNVKGEIDVVRQLTGHSGAVILQVDLETDTHRGMAILKLSRLSDPDEVARHKAAEAEAASYAKLHFPVLVKHHLSPSGMALLFEVAGKSMHQVLPFDRLDYDQQLTAARTIFSDLLQSWNATPTVDTGLRHPAELLTILLDKKLAPESRLSEFADTLFSSSSEVEAYSALGEWLPNPIRYAHRKLWNKAEELKNLLGHIHGDLHGGNLLIRIAGQDTPYYVIDFSYYRPNAPLFFDQAYFELSYLLLKRGGMHPASWLRLLGSVEAQQVHLVTSPDDVGIVSLTSAVRDCVRGWIASTQRDRSDHLNAQYALARVAAGLNFAGKALENENSKLLAYLYASFALKKYLETFQISWERQGPALKLDLPVVEPATDGWRDAWDSCDHFDSARSVFVLVAGRAQQPDASAFSILGRVPWASVFDFDHLSKDSGLYASVAPVLGKDRAVRDMLFDNIGAANYEMATSWFFAAGVEARPDSMPTDQKAWRRMYLPAIRNLCSLIRDFSVPTPITVLILTDGIDMSKIVATWEAMDEVLGDQAAYVVIGKAADVSDKSVRMVKCTSSEFLSGLWLMFGMRPSAVEVRVPARSVTDDTKISVALSVTDATYIAEDLTIIHTGLAAVPTREAAVGFRFWRGGEIQWAELDMEADVRRKCGDLLAKDVEEKLSRLPASVITLEHRPGAGGTTVARRLLWNMRDEQPSVMIHNLSEHTSDRLELLYHLTRLPLLIVAEAHIVPIAALESIVKGLRSRNIRFAVCHVVRTMRGTARHMVPEPMEMAEVAQFLERYRAIAPADRLPLLLNLAQQDSLRRFRSPFFFGLYAFEEQFTHITTYVNAHLAEASLSVRDVIRFLALVSRFSQDGLLDTVVLRLLGLSERGVFRVSDLFGANFSRLIRIDEKRAKIVHPLIAQEVLRQLDGDNWEAKLPELSIDFIDRVVDVTDSRSREVLQLMTNMFISRDFWGESQGRRQFSDLIQSIANDAGQHRVLQKLTEKCPGEATFWNHLGRHHMYIMHSDYHVTEECLQKAIQLEPQNSIHRHALGMAYRFEINRVLRALGGKRSEHESEVGLQAIDQLFLAAQITFEKTRELAPSDEHGYITEIQLICEVIQQLFRLSGHKEYSQLLGRPGKVADWCRPQLDTAEELLRRVKTLQPTATYSEWTMKCQARIAECYGRFESMINSLKLLLMRGAIYRAPVRRVLANAYHARRTYDWRSTTKEDLKEIRSLMQENLEEDSSNERDLFLWLQASRRLPDFDHLETIDRLSRWALNKPTAEIFYYLYILHFVRFYQGIVSDQRLVQESLDQCRALNLRVGRPRSYEWLAQEPSWFPVIHEGELGSWDYAKNIFTKTERLALIRAAVKRIKGPQSGTLALGPFDVFFVPGTDFLPGRDENATVSLFLGFSFEGMRGWNVSRVGRAATT